MRKLLFMMLGFLIGFPTFARDFTYKYEGQTLTYTVLDEAQKTVTTKRGYKEVKNNIYEFYHAGNKVSGDLIIPEIVKDGNTEYSVVEIGFSSFGGDCDYLNSVVIPNSVETIGEYAFFGTDNLTSVTMGSSIKNIEDYAFEWCHKLQSIVIPNSVERIGKRAFDSDALKSVQFDAENCISCGTSDSPAFHKTLLNLVIGNEVHSIPNYAFYNCNNLACVVIPNSVETIGLSAFYGCSGLEKAEFASIESICKIKFENGRANPLYYAHNLYVNGEEIKELVIPESVESIPNYAFYGCNGLTSVKFGDSINTIGKYAFCNCSSLTSLDVPDKIQTISDGAFYNCSGLLSVKIPESVIIIGESAFAYCTHLPTLEIPNQVSIIGKSAFYGCYALTSVKLSDSISSIGEFAFRYCNAIRRVEYLTSDPIEATTNIFDDEVYNNGTLYVPQGSTMLYTDIEPWRLFKKIKEKELSDIETVVAESDNEEYFTLQGTNVSNPQQGQIYIVRKGKITYKEVMK